MFVLYPDISGKKIPNEAVLFIQRDENITKASKRLSCYWLNVLLCPASCFTLLFPYVCFFKSSAYITHNASWRQGWDLLCVYYEAVASHSFILWHIDSKIVRRTRTRFDWAENAEKPNRTSIHLCFQADPGSTCLIRTRVRMSVHATPNEPSYPQRRTRVHLKRTKQRQREYVLTRLLSRKAVGTTYNK